MAKEARDLPAWSWQGDDDGDPLPADWPMEVSREWAWGGSTGSGARVCLLDSGIERGHPLCGEVARAVSAEVGEDGEVEIVADDEGDTCGHGTACAGIIRSIAPDAEIASVRVLGPEFTGSGPAMVGGLRWAVQEGFDVVNLSLSTTKSRFAAALHELTDSAYFRRAVLVSSAHNMNVSSYPWRFASVVSVGSHEGRDALEFLYNPSPPVEFFARGMDVEVAWLDGGTIRSTGNSFATAHMSGICALIRAKRPWLTPFQVKSLLYLTASNVTGQTAA